METLIIFRCQRLLLRITRDTLKMSNMLSMIVLIDAQKRVDTLIHSLQIKLRVSHKSICQVALQKSFLDFTVDQNGALKFKVNQWLTGFEYAFLLRHYRAYMELNPGKYLISDYGHPPLIYEKPKAGQIYFIKGWHLREFGFPRDQLIKKRYKWKKMNFTTDLPKNNPLCTYLVASAKYDSELLRMHVVALSSGNQLKRRRRKQQERHSDADDYQDEDSLSNQSQVISSAKQDLAYEEESKNQPKINEITTNISQRTKRLMMRNESQKFNSYSIKTRRQRSLLQKQSQMNLFEPEIVVPKIAYDNECNRIFNSIKPFDEDQINAEFVEAQNLLDKAKHYIDHKGEQNTNILKKQNQNCYKFNASEDLSENKLVSEEESQFQENSSNNDKSKRINVPKQQQSYVTPKIRRPYKKGKKIISTNKEFEQRILLPQNYDSDSPSKTSFFDKENQQSQIQSFGVKDCKQQQLDNYQKQSLMDVLVNKDISQIWKFQANKCLTSKLALKSTDTYQDLELKKQQNEQQIIINAQNLQNPTTYIYNQDYPKNCNAYLNFSQINWRKLKNEQSGGYHNQSSMMMRLEEILPGHQGNSLTIPCNYQVEQIDNEEINQSFMRDYNSRFFPQIFSQSLKHILSSEKKIALPKVGFGGMSDNQSLDLFNEQINQLVREPSNHQVLREIVEMSSMNLDLGSFDFERRQVLKDIPSNMITSTYIPDQFNLDPSKKYPQ
ncbi:UNKNOWN [Stylonychia lemnae]|uniref:Uncharacterized protein n=1 Tax=Stylonychia lemnae TaxID=5949 RepID=A0A078AEZ8_STYLE|nr:UNKNOWN [Stylonychia lemnae]|eukprot:CDW80376.1 UNKNOWN [Stylonychia lemnae]